MLFQSINFYIAIGHGKWVPVQLYSKSDLPVLVLSYFYVLLVPLFYTE
jgi:hypothetical protein